METEPLRLFQEDLRREPFWMLVACVLVNRTTWSAAEPVLAEIRKKWPTPLKLSRTQVSFVWYVVQRLGLGDARSKNIVAIAKLWVWNEQAGSAAGLTHLNILEWPGCGQYAADSWAVFVQGKPNLVRPKDAKIRSYLRRLRRDRNKGKT